HRGWRARGPGSRHRCTQMDGHRRRPRLRIELAIARPGRGARVCRFRGGVRPRLRGRVGQGDEPRTVRRGRLRGDMTSPARAVPLVALAVGAVVTVSAQTTRSVLFIGNSFTFAAGSPVRFYRPGTVTDLNDEGIGGVPAMFKSFTRQ